MINLKLKDVRELFKRRYTLMEIGIEIVSYKKKSMYLVFNDMQTRNYVYSILLAQVSKDCITTEQSIELYT